MQIFSKGMIVMNKAKKRQQAMRQKLIAAVAMLMVSAIMVVSSSYAWFTLSTAPEVTGIQTSVGANGNLEMALYNGTTITSNVGDASKPDLEKNITWGNLVDLSNEAYGLNKINLMPARLNYDGAKIGASHLSTPSYGADGRVDKLETESLSRYWNVMSNGWSGAGNGVMAIGNASGLSAEQQALRQAKINFVNAIEAAKVTAAGSLNTTGEKLTAMAVEVKMNGATTVKKADVEAVQTTLAQLTSAKDSLGTALLNYLHALATTREGAAGTIIANYATLDKLADLKAEMSTALQNDAAFTAAYDAYTAMDSDLDDATTDLATAIGKADSDGNILWTDVSAAMAILVDTDKMVLNGYPLNTIKVSGEGANAGEIASAIVKQGGLRLVTSAGVYSDIADFTGSYTASFEIASITISGITVTEFPASMVAEPTAEYKTEQHNAKLSTVINAVTADKSTGASATTALTDLYGYKIDLAFRTNAAGSYLKLQSAAADRIYGDNATDADTYGGGSYMEFNVATLGYTKAQAKEVMKAIRIVFMETTSNDTDSAEIYGIAVLDTTNATETANGWKATLKLVNYSFVADGTNGYKLHIGTDKNGDDKDKLIDLSQSVQKNLSVMVYLDGDHVENEDVATGTQSLTGLLNLQFASSAELKPMDYSDLHTSGNN